MLETKSHITLENAHMHVVKLLKHHLSNDSRNNNYYQSKNRLGFELVHTNILISSAY